MKLHRLSIPYRIVERLFSLLVILFIVPFVVAGFTGDGVVLVVATGGTFLLIVALAVGWEVAYYRRYEYELTPDTFDIRSGVLSRREREIPYGRIQNVSINRNVFQRLLGLAEVRFETAGGSGSEAHLRFVSHEHARELQNELSDRKRDQDARKRERGIDQDEPRVSEETAPTKLYEIDGHELAILGVVSFDFRFFSLLIVLLPAFGGEISQLVDGAGVSLLVLAAPIGIILLYLVSAIVSGLYAVTNYYGFKLYRTGRELRYERGLLQRFSGTIPLEKVQTLSITENVLARRFGYASLLLETAGFSPGETGGSQSAIPIARRERVETLARDIEPHGHIDFQRPPKRARERYFFRYLIVVGVLTAVAFAVTQWTGVDGPWYAVLGLAVLAPPAAHLKWLHRGYALCDGHVVTRNDFWSRKITIVPYHRIQTVLDSQTIFQRRRNLATLTIDTAGASGLMGNESKAVDIDADVARELREEISSRLLQSVAKKREESQKRRREQLLEDELDTTVDQPETTSAVTALDDEQSPDADVRRGDDGDDNASDPDRPEDTTSQDRSGDDRSNRSTIGSRIDRDADRSDTDRE